MAGPASIHLSPRLPVLKSTSMEKTTASELTPSRLGFPNEFPYEFDSPVFSPGFTSPGDSTETEDESSDDEEDFLAGLTRRLAPSTQRQPLHTKTEENRQTVATSPQSTLSGLGSWSASGNGSPTFPSTQVPSSRRDNAWDVISAAAGQVAKLKMGNLEPYVTRQNPNPNPLFRRHAPPSNPILPPPNRQNAAFQADQCFQQYLFDQMCSEYAKIKCSEQLNPTVEKLRYMRRTGLSHPSWTPQPAAFPAVPAPVKRPSAGTGVFLPRRYPIPSDSHKNSGNTTVMFNSKVHQLNHTIDDVTTKVVQASLSARRSQFEYECMLARSGVVGRQGNMRTGSGVNGGGCLSQERRLPQDWMY